MNLRKCMFINNACYKSGQKIKVKGIMWHSTGANNPNLRRYVQPDDGLLGVNPNGNHWNQSYPQGTSVCVHAWIGKLADGSIATYQTLPWDINGWHSGGNANNSYIGFEICEGNLDDKAYFQAVYKEAVEFSAYLCKQFGLNPLAGNTIIDHSTGAKLGIASGHADVLHWFSRFGVTLDKIRRDIANEMNKGSDSLMSKEYDELKKENATLRQELADNVRWINETMAQMRAHSAANSTRIAEIEFTDSTEGALKCPQWAKEAVQYCIDHGYINGDGGQEATVDTVRPMSKLTRAEMCQILYNLRGEKDAE